MVKVLNDPDVLEVITISLIGLFLYFFFIMYFIVCRLIRVRSASGLASMPKDIGMHKRLPQAGVYTKATLPKKFTESTFEPEGDIWVNYRVHRGIAVVQLESLTPDEEPVQCFLDEFNYGLLKPLQKHMVIFCTDDCLMHIELLTSKNQDSNEE